MLTRAIALLLSLLASPALAQVTPGTSPLTGPKGGTNNAFMQFGGPAGSLKTFTLPNASDTIDTLNAIQTFTAQKTFNAGAIITGGSGAFTSGLSYLNTQNAATTVVTTNTSTGTSALVAYNATNLNGTAGYGVGGSGFTGLTILQNRAYVDAQTGLGGIILNNEGANPTVFGISSAEVGRWDSSAPGRLIHGLAGSTVGQSCFGNATSGTECIVPATGALGSGIATLPAGTYNFVGDSLSQTLTGKTIAGASNTLSVRIANDVTGLGTGVATALGVNVGSAGAFVANGGALGTPSSGTLTNATGLPTTGLTGTLQGALEPAHTGDCTNTAGSLALNCTGINGVNQNAAWTTYTPTITAGAGTPTTVTATGRYKQIGKTVFAEIDITITAIGTATGTLLATLPVSAAAFHYSGSVFEYITAGKSGAGFINGVSSPTQIQTRDAAAGSWWVNGNALAVTVTYEVP